MGMKIVSFLSIDYSFPLYLFFPKRLRAFVFFFLFFFYSLWKIFIKFFLIMDSIVNIINNVTFCQVYFFFLYETIFYKNDAMRFVYHFCLFFFFFCSFYNTPPRYSSGTEKNHFSYASSKMRISPDDEYARGAREVTQ